jgi:hypothetical protein
MVGERVVGMQGPALRATGRNSFNKKLAGRWFDGEARAAQRPEGWKRNFLMCNGLSYLAERQAPHGKRALSTVTWEVSQ